MDDEYNEKYGKIFNPLSVDIVCNHTLDLYSLTATFYVVLFREKISDKLLKFNFFNEYDENHKLIYKFDEVKFL